MIAFVVDMVTDGDQESVFDSEFFTTAAPNVRQMMANVPLQSCMGNHEGSGALYVKYVPFPFVGARFRSFDYGPVHFTVIDQYVAYTPGSPQYAWIQTDLAVTTKPWRFVIMHEPDWSAGTHANNTNVQANLRPQPLLRPRGGGQHPAPDRRRRPRPAVRAQPDIPVCRRHRPDLPLGADHDRRLPSRFRCRQRDRGARHVRHLQGVGGGPGPGRRSPGHPRGQSEPLQPVDDDPLHAAAGRSGAAVRVRRRWTRRAQAGGREP